jgi:hypothetical protein
VNIGVLFSGWCGRPCSSVGLFISEFLGLASQGRKGHQTRITGWETVARSVSWLCLYLSESVSSFVKWNLNLSLNRTKSQWDFLILKYH